jgi:hypothetical protein
MILLKPFDFLVGDLNFDCAYTLRKNSTKFPINGGLAIYKNNPQGLKILNDLIEEYQNLPNQEKAWWGDQICLVNCFSKNLKELALGLHDYQGSKILLVDAFKYNYTPFDMDMRQETLMKNIIIDKDLASWIDSPVQTKFLLHFKGMRKHLQLQVDWQIENNSNYLEFIQGKFDKFKGEIASLGKNFFKHQEILNYPHFIVNDLAVIAFIESIRENPKISNEISEDFILALQSSHNHSLRTTLKA